MQSRNEKSLETVLALTIIDGNTLNDGVIVDSTQMLLAVRNPETNITHPNVISVPTQRIPEEMLKNLEKSSSVEYEDKLSATTILKSEIFDSSLANGDNPLIFAVESILCRKLSLADYLEHNQIEYMTCLRGLVTGTVKHAVHSENTVMINAIVVITKGFSLIPNNSASFSHIISTSVNTFIETASHKNPLLLRRDLNPFEYCIHGLCIMSSFNIIAHTLGLNFYPHAIYNK